MYVEGGQASVQETSFNFLRVLSVQSVFSLREGERFFRISGSHLNRLQGPGCRVKMETEPLQDRLQKQTHSLKHGTIMDCFEVWSVLVNLPDP